MSLLTPHRRAADRPVRQAPDALSEVDAPKVDAPAPASADSALSGTVDDGHTSTFAALHVRNYRLFFAGQVVSNTGTWMQRIAQDCHLGGGRGVITGHLVPQPAREDQHGSAQGGNRFLIDRFTHIMSLTH